MALRTSPKQPHVSRKVRATPFARRSLESFVTRLRSLQTSDWPPRLSGAWKILTNTLGLPDAKARSLVLQSVPIAHDCIKAQSKRVDRIEANQAPARIRRTCHRVSKCIKRAPAILRRRLDAEIPTLIKNIESDLETIEAIFVATKAAFEDQQYRESEAVRTGIEALKPSRAADYSMLDTAVRGQVLSALAKLVSSGRQVKSAEVFAIVGGALDNWKAQTISLESRDLRTRYVAHLKIIWLEAGLKPGRSIAYLDDTYRSRFHRFAELVYVGMAASSRIETRQLAGRRPWLALEKADYKWEISDDHVRNGLKASLRILARPTP
jgi:hypothetical protein